MYSSFVHASYLLFEEKTFVKILCEYFKIVCLYFLIALYVHDRF